MERRFDSLIVLLFSILPLIDTMNGLFRGYPIGVAYKTGLCLLLMVIVLLCDGYIRKYTAIMIAVAGYVFLSMIINLAIGGSVISFDFPIKLIFNVFLLCTLIMCLRGGIISDRSIYAILDISSWIFIACFMIPYGLGVGYSVYANKDGYKAFFISQNELGIVVAVMSFFTAYKLISKTNMPDVIRLGLLVLIGMLLNTKAAMVASIIAVLLWIIPVVIKGRIGVRAVSIALFVFGFVILRDRIVSAITTAFNRYSWLKSSHGSQLGGVLSGRNIFVDNAIKEFTSGNHIVRFAIGNGFCSDTLIEMDLFDIFFYLGAIGLVATLCCLVLILKRSYANAKVDGNALRTVSFVVILLMMILSGHVLFMSMSGCYFALYVCFLLFCKTSYLKGKSCQYESVS